MTAKALSAFLPGLLVPSSLCLLLFATAALWSCNLDDPVIVSQMLYTALILLLLPAGDLATSQSMFLQPLRQEVAPPQPLTYRFKPLDPSLAAEACSSNTNTCSSFCLLLDRISYSAQFISLSFFSLLSTRFIGACCSTQLVSAW